MTHTVARSMTGAAVMVLACAASAGDGPMRIESCVGGSAIEFGAIDQHVALDAADKARVHAEMQQRYPVLAQHGFPVSKIVLWHKTGSEPVFIALLTDPTRAGEPCFTATFAAA